MPIRLGCPAAIARTRSLMVSLPTELIINIIESTPPDSHLNIALVCRRLADCAHDVLHRHRIAHNRYCVASDHDPATVLTLLRSVFGFGDLISAWHVRSFESWDLRRMIAHDGFPDPPRQGGYRYEDGFEWAWHDGEVDAYFRVFEEAAFSADDLDAIRRNIRDQHDATLKMLLFVTLPRLRDLKLARSPRAEAEGPLAQHEPYASLEWLPKAIEKGVHQALHGPGLRGLESLAIGVETGDNTEGADFFTDQRCWTGAKLMLRLMRLPRLSSLYVHGLSDWLGDEEDDLLWQDHDGGIHDPDPGSSAVEHLFLDGSDSLLSTDFMCALIVAPLALKTFALRPDVHEVHYIDSTIRDFLKVRRETLGSMMVYNPELCWGRYSSLFCPEQFTSVCYVRQFSHDVQDHLRHAIEPTPEHFVWYFCKAIPQCLEVLVLHGDEHYVEIENCEDPIGEAVAALLDSGDHNLKTVYLCGFEDRDDGTRHGVGVNGEEVRFQKAITSGIRCGVDVITRTTRREDLINPEPSFPRAVDRYDLMTGRFGGHRPPADKGRLFDPVSGTRRAELCDHCGECDDCLAIYPRGLWVRAREERAWAMWETQHDESADTEYSGNDEEGGDEGEDGKGSGENEGRAEGDGRDDDQVVNSR